MTIMEKLIKDVARITGYDYSEYKNKVGKESIFFQMTNTRRFKYRKGGDYPKNKRKKQIANNK